MLNGFGPRDWRENFKATNPFICSHDHIRSLSDSLSLFTVLYTVVNCIELKWTTSGR